MVRVNRTAGCPLSDSAIRAIVAYAQTVEKKVHGDVEISFVGEDRMRTLNRTTRGMDKPTDVLSFAWRDSKKIGKSNDFLGELYLSYRYIVRQARRFKVPAREETIRILAHGLLHLAGHDHLHPRAARKMFALQEKIVSHCS